MELKEALEKIKEVTTSCDELKVFIITLDDAIEFRELDNLPHVREHVKNHHIWRDLFHDMDEVWDPLWYIDEPEAPKMDNKVEDIPSI